MTEEELSICKDANDRYGRVSVSYLMRKLACTASEAEDITQDWNQFCLDEIEAKLMGLRMGYEVKDI
jgi:hypothetical protein